MPLTLKQIAGSPDEDFHAMYGELRIGQMYRRKISLRPDSEWLWALNGVPVSADELALTGLSAGRDEATAALEARWKSWLAWAQFKEVD